MVLTLTLCFFDPLSVDCVHTFYAHAQLARLLFLSFFLVLLYDCAHIENSIELFSICFWGILVCPHELFA
jgi:hypothetical protein